MTERPILFSGPMVRAILEGRKTQTRRVARFKTLEPGFNLGFSGVSAGHYCTGEPASGAVLYSRGRGGVWQQRTQILHCPYGQPGDRLWVRETWGAVSPHEFHAPLKECRIEYRADLPPGCTDGPGHWAKENYGDPDACKWRPAIHMPRWASRLTLEVTAVRVERLQDISEEDAKAEGIEQGSNGYWLGADQRAKGKLVMAVACPTARGAFASLWDSIHDPRVTTQAHTTAEAWDANPWVWVLEFRRVDETRKAVAS